MIDHKKIIQVAKDVLQIEADSILNLNEQLNENFCRAVEMVLECQGKVVVTGIGKSGHIARKISSTMSSTGTASFYLHPAESSHGDLGVVSKKDLVIAISYGGEAAELNAILNYTTRNDIKLIALTGKPESTLGKAATIVLNIFVKKEACPLSLAPTSSSTATLAMGDALAMAVLDQKGFTANDFAAFHPSGTLGLRLRKIKDIMKKDDAIPFIYPHTSMKEILTKMTSYSVRGAAGVIDANKDLIGIITDGDIRRFLEKNDQPFKSVAEDIMTKNPKTIDANEAVEKALSMMEKNKIQVLIVLDNQSSTPKKPVGMIAYQDLLSTK